MHSAQAERIRNHFNNLQQSKDRYTAKKRNTMNMFSKFLSLGLCASIVMAAPMLARDKKCCIVGSYIGAIDNNGNKQPVEAQFHEDGTATIFVFDESAPTRPYVGAWKQLGHKCIKFCTASPTSPTSRITLNGKICFDNQNCKNLSGTVTFSTGGNTPLLQEPEITIALQRVDCCQ